MVRFIPRSRFFRLARGGLYRRPFRAVVWGIQNAASRRIGRTIRRSPLPATICIETRTDCNNDCAFCPQSSEPRRRAVMPETVFTKLVASMATEQFSGDLVFGLNNEPLLDQRLAAFIRQTRDAGFPGQIRILTNGLLLTRDRATSLFAAGADTFTVNAYSNDGQSLPAALQEWVFQTDAACPPPGKQMNVYYRCKNEVLTNRAGNAPNKRRPTLRHASCSWPFRMLPVTTDGSALLCCNDFYCTTKFANISGASLAEIWAAAFLEDARERLARAERRRLPLCTGCDFKGYLNPCSVWFARILRI